MFVSFWFCMLYCLLNTRSCCIQQNESFYNAALLLFVFGFFCLTVDGSVANIFSISVSKSQSDLLVTAFAFGAAFDELADFTASSRTAEILRVETSETLDVPAAKGTDATGTDTTGTAATDTDAADSDAVDTDKVDTDALDTDAADTDATCFAATGFAATGTDADVVEFTAAVAAILKLEDI
jgi:hypothetical protein